MSPMLTPPAGPLAVQRSRALLWACGGLLGAVALNACSLDVGASGPVVQLIDASDPVVADPPARAGDAGAPARGQSVPVGAEHDAEVTQQPGQPPEAGSDMQTDGGVDASPSAPDTAAPDPGTCDLEGRYALHILFDVTWVGTELLSFVPVIDPGEGKLSITLLMELRAGPTGYAARLRECATQVPEFVASLSGEHYQTEFEAATWDSPSMPEFTSTLEPACDIPGCSLGGSPLIALFGVSLPSDDAPWPDSPARGRWPDDDGDGAPGITARMLGPREGPYAYPPLDVLSRRRLRSLMLGLRVKSGIRGVLSSCDTMRGETLESSVQTRAVGCTASSPPYTCESNELSFVNNNLPVWSVQNGTFEVQRVSDDADCELVRTAIASGASAKP